jgi:hypothetical protein
MSGLCFRAGGDRIANCAALAERGFWRDRDGRRNWFAPLVAGAIADVVWGDDGRGGSGGAPALSVADAAAR